MARSQPFVLRWASFERGRYVAVGRDGSRWEGQRVGDQDRHGGGTVTRRLAAVELQAFLLGRRVGSWRRCVTEMTAAVDRGRRVCV
jgi:hypothetical protein